MSTSVFTVQGHEFVAGLSWSIVSSVASANKSVEKGSAYIVRTSVTDASMALGVGPKRVAKTYAAGVVIGSKFADAIIFSELEDGGGFWVCALSGGLPGADCDVVLPTEEEARAKYSEVTSYLTGHVKTIGTVRGASMTVDEAINEALSAMVGVDAKPKQLTSALKSYRLQVRTFNWVRFVMIFVGLVVLAGLVTAGFVYRANVLDRHKREKLLAEALKSRQEREAIQLKRASEIAKFRAEVELERGRFGRQEVVWAQWNACEQVRRSLPLSRFGYVPNKLTCDFERGKADLEWAPVGATTRLADRAALPGIVDKYATALVAVSSFDLKPLDTAAKVVPLNPAAVRLAILDWGGVRLRSLRIEPSTAVVLTPPKEIADEPGLVPVKLGDKAVISLGANDAVDYLVAPAAMHMLNSYAVELRDVVWMKPTSQGVSMHAAGVLYLPEAKN